MLEKKTASNILTFVLVSCALFITGLIVQQVFFQTPHTNQPESSNIRTIENWEELDIGNLQAYSRDAEINIIKFFDYQCPFCKQSQNSTDLIKDKYKDSVNFVYVHFPLITHEFAFKSAVASECARNQGSFENYHALLFKNQESLDQISYPQLAVEAGVNDTSEFNYCVENQKTYDRINQNIDFANKLEINIIPSYLINGKLIPGLLTEEELEYYIFSE